MSSDVGYGVGDLLVGKQQVGLIIKARPDPKRYQTPDRNWSSLEYCVRWFYEGYTPDYNDTWDEWMTISNMKSCLRDLRLELVKVKQT